MWYGIYKVIEVSGLIDGLVLSDYVYVILGEMD